MRSAILAAALVLATSCASLGPRASFTLAIGATAADCGTTAMALQDGAREANPILGQSAARACVVNAALITVAWLLIRNHDPETQSKVWQFLAALHVAAAANNVYQMR